MSTDLMLKRIESIEFPANPVCLNLPSPKQTQRQVWGRGQSCEEWGWEQISVSTIGHSAATRERFVSCLRAHAMSRSLTQNKDTWVLWLLRENKTYSKTDLCLSHQMNSIVVHSFYHSFSSFIISSQSSIWTVHSWTDTVTHRSFIKQMVQLLDLTERICSLAGA